ncbi:glycogen debranching protein GlgX [Marinimicrococcus flavescens]|uniref:Glycogen debranching protein GlgX n=1 Tax=Marinimicrococcus flavescens TaxID=3031815 RepID=A0AAP3V1N5_9PROT|nr:glycogen debranching protein GlgX [Marinimicrococcus flavescens]
MSGTGAPRPGRPWPLGVTAEEDGLNVAVFSAHASGIDLCLFDPAGLRETARLPLPEHTEGVFHGFFPGLAAGQVYGLRAHGPWDPARGHRFNPARLLLDPHARALCGRVRWEGPNLVDPAHPFACDPRDSAAFVAKAVALPPVPPAPEGGRPGTPWDKSLLYEAHVRGMTMLHPAVPEAQRGRFAGLSHPRVLEHLQRLGVTAVELMPVTALLDEHRLTQLGLRNYWGYNPLAFMVPEPRYAGEGGDPLAEFRAMVRALHEAGIEVILDMVFNHTAESDHLGPILSMKGLDNASYYRLRPDDRRRYVDDTGCGNTLNLAHPRVLQLVMDALRYWAALGVDGFRFDLATTLARGRSGAFDAHAPFLQAIAQDPVLGRLKLVAEPWDVGGHGYRAGQFPAPFAEWNDRFRDTVRRFWRGDEGVLPDLGARLLGSADRFEHDGRRPWASVNYVTAHDGFTLADTVSYARRHNEANGEGNRDGHHGEISAGNGAEGPSDDPAVRETRDRLRRAMLASLLLAQGTPMLLMGDELGRSQQGNNNAYCQDNPISWCHWDGIMGQGGGAGEEAMIAFIGRLAALRREHPVLRRRRFLHGRVRSPSGVPDVQWLTRDGVLKRADDWRAPHNRCLGLLLEGAAGSGKRRQPEGNEGGREAMLLLLVNADPLPLPFSLPRPGGIAGWTCLLDTAEPEGVPAAVREEGGTALVGARSLRLYRALREGDEEMPA